MIVLSICGHGVVRTRTIFDEKTDAKVVTWLGHTSLSMFNVKETKHRLLKPV
jgi:hypothetical protein